MDHCTHVPGTRHLADVEELARRMKDVLDAVAHAIECRQQVCSPCLNHSSSHWCTLQEVMAKRERAETAERRALQLAENNHFMIEYGKVVYAPPRGDRSTYVQDLRRQLDTAEAMFEHMKHRLAEEEQLATVLESGANTFKHDLEHQGTQLHHVLLHTRQLHESISRVMKSNNKHMRSTPAIQQEIEQVYTAATDEYRQISELHDRYRLKNGGYGLRLDPRSDTNNETNVLLNDLAVI
jgi:hypothetical protein